MGSSLQHARMRLFALASVLLMAMTYLVVPPWPGGVTHADTGTQGQTGAQGQFVALPAAGLFDTVSGAGGNPVGKIPAKGTATFQVAGKLGIPASGVSAVAVNIWIRTAPTATGYISVYASDKPTTVSTLIYQAGELGSVDDFIQLTSTGKLTVNNYGASAVDVRVAVRGYFLDASATQAATEYRPLTAAYVYDSRPDVGPADGPKVPLSPNTDRVLQIAGKAGVPASGVTSVAINMTTLGATATAGIQIWADGESDPQASTLLYNSGENNSLMDVVRLGQNGRLRVRSNGGNPVNLTISVRGYFTTASTSTPGGAGFEVVTPKTLIATDSGLGTPGGATTPLPARGSLTFTATTATTTPVERIDAVVGNITAYQPAATGNLSLTPAGSTTTKTSTLEFQAGEVSQTTDIVPPGTGGKLTVTNNSSSTVHIRFAIRGYFVLSPPQAVAKVVDTATGTEDLATDVTSDADSVAVASQPATEEDAGMTVDVPRDAGNGVTFTDGSGTLVLGLPASGEATATPSGTVVFDGSQDGFSTAVQPTEDGVRALVHIDNKNSPRTYDFSVTLPDGATMVVDDEDGSVGIIKAVPAAEIEGLDEIEDGTAEPGSETPGTIEDGTDPAEGDTPDTVVQMLNRIEVPWAKDATGRNWPTKFTVEGNILKLSVDLAPATTESGEPISPVYPVVTDPNVKRNCGITTCSWYFSRNVTKNLKDSLASYTAIGIIAATYICTRIPHPVGVATCASAMMIAGTAAVYNIVAGYNRGGCFVVRLNWGAYMAAPAYPPAIAKILGFSNAPLSNKYCYAK